MFLSFFLMLVFMTYNVSSCSSFFLSHMAADLVLRAQGYLIAATVIGAGVGHYVYNRELDPLCVTLSH